MIVMERIELKSPSTTCCAKAPETLPRYSMTPYSDNSSESL